jgi:hypothetical protein
MPRDHQLVRLAVRQMVEVLRRDYEVENDEDTFVLREVVKTLVWKHTEALPHVSRKVLNCPIWSEAAFREFFLHRERGGGRARLIVEHVMPRAVIVRLLMDNPLPQNLEAILSEPQVCVVHANEHGTLQGDDGWERYRRQQVRVARISMDHRAEMARRATSAGCLAKIMAAYEFACLYPPD